MSPNVATAILWVIAAVAGSLGVVIWRQKIQPGRRLLATLCWAIGVWCFGYGAELGCQTLDEMRWWTAAQYPGIVLVAPLWLLFAVRYTRIREFRNPWELVAILLIPAVALIAVWTNEYHHWYYSQEGVITEGGLYLRHFLPGPIYMIHLVYAWGCVLLGMMALLRQLPATAGPFTANVVLLLIAVAVPFVAALARAFGWEVMGPLDPTPFSFACSAVLLAVLVARRTLLMLRPIARDRVIDSLEHGMMTVDEAGRITDANASMASMLSLPRDRVVGYWWDVFAAYPEVRQLFQPGGPRSIELTLGSGDAARTVEATATVLHNESNELVGHVLLFRDITEQYRAKAAVERERRLIEAEAEVAMRLVSSPDIGYAVQSAIQKLGEAAEVDRVYIFENSTGPNGEPLLSQTFEWAAPGVPPQIGLQELQNMPYFPDYGRWYELLSTGQPVKGHVRNFPPAERPLLEVQDIQSILVLPITLDGVFWGFMGFDETHEEREWTDSEVATLATAAAAVGNAIARSRVLADLRRSERRFRSYFELPLTGLVILGADGRVQEANEAFCGIVGCAVRDVIGHPWSDFVAVSTDPVEDSPGAPGARSGSGEARLRHSRGHLVPALVAARSVPQEGGSTEYTIIAVHDISELKQKEEQLEELTRHLRERVDDQTLALRNATAELEAFEDKVASELGTQLRIARQYAHYLADPHQKLEPAERVHIIGMIGEALDELDAMLREMHRLHATGKGEMYAVGVNLSEIAARVEVLMREKYPARPVELVVQPGLTAKADPRHVERVLVELFDNAWKFTAPVARPRVELGAENTGRGLAFFVRDNGGGFDEAMTDRLFHIFERLHTQEEFAGRGVGLAIVQRLIARNGGHVWAVGRRGEGATFYFTLPTPDNPGK